MSNLSFCANLHSAIFSQALESGPTPCAAPDGPTTAPCGPEAPRANLSARQAKAAGLMTSGTYGPHSTTSLASAALASSLASRLKQRLDTDGSTLFNLTWKEKVTPSGRVYSAHTASARPISANASFGWPSPQAHDKHGGKTPEQVAAMRLRSKAGVSNLNEVCQLVPITQGWNTPRATDGSKGGPNQSGGALPADAALTGWATPTTLDHKDGTAKSCENVPTNKLLGREVHGATPESSSAATERPAAFRLNPLFSLWLMGYPVGWACSGVRAMQSCRKSRRSSSKRT